MVYSLYIIVHLTVKWLWHQFQSIMANAHHNLTMPDTTKDTLLSLSLWNRLCSLSWTSERPFFEISPTWTGLAAFPLFRAWSPYFHGLAHCPVLSYYGQPNTHPACPMGGDCPFLAASRMGQLAFGNLYTHCSSSVRETDANRCCFTPSFAPGRNCPASLECGTHATQIPGWGA